MSETQLHLVAASCPITVACALVTKSYREAQSDRTFLRDGSHLHRQDGKRTVREARLRTVEGTDTRDSFAVRYVVAFGGVSVFPPGGNDDE